MQSVSKSSQDLALAASLAAAERYGRDSLGEAWLYAHDLIKRSPQRPHSGQSFIRHFEPLDEAQHLIPIDNEALQEWQMPSLALHQKQLTKHLHRSLAKLSPRAERIMRLRFGIGEPYLPCRDHPNGPSESEGLTFTEIGKIMGFATSERARQIVAKSLRMIAHPFHSRALREFYWPTNWPEYHQAAESSGINVAIRPQHGGKIYDSPEAALADYLDRHPDIAELMQYAQGNTPDARLADVRINQDEYHSRLLDERRRDEEARSHAAYTAAREALKQRRDEMDRHASVLREAIRPVCAKFPSISVSMTGDGNPQNPQFIINATALGRTRSLINGDYVAAHELTDALLNRISDDLAAFNSSFCEILPFNPFKDPDPTDQHIPYFHKWTTSFRAHP